MENLHEILLLCNIRGRCRLIQGAMKTKRSLLLLTILTALFAVPAFAANCQGGGKGQKQGNCARDGEVAQKCACECGSGAQACEKGQGACKESGKDCPEKGKAECAKNCECPADKDACKQSGKGCAGKGC